MDWRASYRRGRAPTLIQMRVLQTVVLPTSGPDVARAYERVFGFEIARATIYSTLGTMHERGQVTKERDPGDGKRKLYHLTRTGVSVLAEGIMKYRRVVEPPKRARNAIR